MALTPTEATDRWERKCDPSKGCRTACCYFEGSPCEELFVTDHSAGVGRCRVYPMRFGEHQTVAGATFRCVPFGQWLQHRPAPDACGYEDVVRVNGVPVVRGQR